MKLFSSYSNDRSADPKFKELFRDFWDKEGMYALRSLEGFPEDLDLENCECQGVDYDGVHFIGGGDWQDMTAFTVGLDKGKLKVVTKYERLDKDSDLSLEDWLAEPVPDKK